MSGSTESISCSAEEIEGNDCLLTQILVRLPLRDVITFKPVSKRTSHGDCFQTMIYSSESSVWKPGLPFRAPFNVCRAFEGVYFKDSVYWVIDGVGCKQTLRFDLNDECLKDDVPPLPLVHGSPYHQVLPLAPACGYMNFLDLESVCCIRVFQLKEDDSSSSSRWILMHSIDLRSTNLEIDYKIRSDRKFYMYSVLHLMEDEEDEMVLLVQLRNKVVAVRLKDKSYYDVFHLPIPIKEATSLTRGTAPFPTLRA
ncbi:hypothetical protein PIB30_078331 [Stylosanthes scabra]|uniref:F-box protein n=1 Tax=Stylosanthes scabra TaxID=79078 RepID=A0ABU6TQC8_9FABA|nr:hypothetical protein [Stylosanthes scabra]